MDIKAIDLFCGVGGLTHGLQLAGINVVAGFDIEDSCRFPYEVNNKSKFFLSDVTKITKKEINLLLDGADIKIIAGCAPCQPFSLYSQRYRKDGRKDDKWKLLYSFAKIINDCSPDIVAMENVPQLKQEPVFLDFVNTLKSLNYATDPSFNRTTYKEKVQEIVNGIVNGATIFLSDTIKRNGGNFDDKVIKKLCDKHGIRYTASDDKGDLFKVKNCRNQLAHGIDSFSNYACDITIKDLQHIMEGVLNFITSILDGMEDYYKNKLFLVK